MLLRLFSLVARVANAATFSPSRALIAGVILLAPAALFLLAVTLKEALGIGTLFAPIEALISAPDRQRIFNVISPVVFLGGLAAALLLNCLAIANFDLEWRQGRWISSVAIEPRMSNVMLIAGVALMLATLVSYAVVENYALLAHRAG